MQLGITEILLISTPQDTPRFQELLGDGVGLGLHLCYKVQNKPEGIAQAFIIGEEYIGNDPIALILGDNIFHGIDNYSNAISNFENGALIFGYSVTNPKRYGVIEFDEDDKPLSIEEKPVWPKSSYIVSGLYFYDQQVVDIAKELKPSARGELEISDINQTYLDNNQLTAIKLSPEVVWLDSGTHASMLEASNFVDTMERSEGQKLACLEEIAYRQKYIDSNQFQKLISGMVQCSYRDYLEQILDED